MSIKFVLAFAAVGAAGLGIAGAGDASQDERDVAAVVELYFEGAKTATAGPFEKAWNLDHGRMLYVREKDGVETMTAVPIGEAIKNWTSKPAEESRGKILSIDAVDGKMAVAKVELLWRGNVYIDFLSLLKIGGEWKIVNKTFVSLGAPN